jgi:plasmid maintenance system antidote protein VapI
MSSDPFDPFAPGEINSNSLIDALLDRFSLKNDAALCRILNISPALISKLRHKKTRITADLLITMHEFTGLSIKELRNLMGDLRPNFEINERADRTIERQRIGEDAIVLFSQVSSVVIQKISDVVLVITINGTPAMDIGEPMFVEIRSYFKNDHKVALFIDLQKATPSSIAISAWTEFLTENSHFISHFKVLAVSIPAYLTINTIKDAVSKPGLIRIFDQEVTYEACLDSAKRQNQLCSGMC